MAKTGGAKVRLSFGIMTHNETAEIARLLQYLLGALRADMEIVVVDDYSDAETKSLLETYAGQGRIRLFTRALDRNFGAQRTYLKQQCRGEYIFMIDADEMPPAAVTLNINAVLDFMASKDIDAIAFPRVNTVDGVSRADSRGRFRVDEKGHIRFPDYQVRLLRNRPQVHWVGRVHERIACIGRRYDFPPEDRFSLIHAKTRERHEQAIALYRSFTWRQFEKFKKSWLKRFGRLHPGERLDLPPPV